MFRNIMTEVRFVEPGDTWTEPGDIQYVVYKNEVVSDNVHRLHMIVIAPGKRPVSYSMPYERLMPMAINRPS